MKSTVVVGGGISGLTAAWWLRREGADVTVFERDTHPGGTMRTLHDNGWLIESGPNSALETTPLFSEMFAGLGILERRLYPDRAADRRYIVRNGRLHPLPMSPGAFLRSRLWTTRGKLRLLKEPFVGRAESEESIAAFVERRLGREFLDYAINPFVAGVYAGNPEQLSVRAAFPKLYALEARYGGLIRGMIGGRKERKQRAEKAKDRARLFSFADGMETFPHAIAGALGEGFRSGHEVTGIEWRGAGEGFTVHFRNGAGPSQTTASSVILSVPARAAAALLEGVAPALSRRLEQVYYPPVAQVFLGYATDRIGVPLDGFGLLVPAKEQRTILGTIWSSVLFPGRAPDGHVALTTFVGGSRQPDLVGHDDKALCGMVDREMHALMGVTGEPVFARVIRWEHAIPQYTLGYGALLDDIDAVERSVPGLFLCANYRGGIAVGDCVMSGERTARRVLLRLAENEKFHESAVR